MDRELVAVLVKVAIEVGLYGVNVVAMVINGNGVCSITYRGP